MSSEVVDPTSATSLALRRRTFVGLSAGAAAFGSAAPLAAAPVTLGAPHDPFVPENDPQLETLRLQLPYRYRGAERTLDSYAARPKSAKSYTPGVVVVQAAWGVDSQIRDTVRRLAKEGYVAIAPDLYSGLGAPSGDSVSDFAAFRDFLGKLEDDTVDHDLAQGAAWVKRQGSPSAKVAVMGFCVGGGITLRQTVDNAPPFVAASVFYGSVRYGSESSSAKGPIVPIDLAYASSIGIPLLGSWGGRDTSILPDDVRALERRLLDLGKPHDFKIYDEAGHAFFDDTRNSYVASAADDAWSRTIAWFRHYLI